MVIDKDLIESILSLINKNEVETNKKCGISAVKISQILGLEYSEIKEVFNYLYQTKQIKVRKGINNHLLFLP